MAGIGDQCSNRGMKQFTESLGDFSGSKGYCVYVSIATYICFLKIVLTRLLHTKMEVY